MSAPVEAKWIQKAHVKKGSFTRSAHRHGFKTAAAFKREVLAHPEKYSEHTVRQANLMNTFSHMHGQLCEFCVEQPVQAECGGVCGQLMYCSQECADGHYSLHKDVCK